MAVASLFWVIPNPSMKSSMRISPGWIGSIRFASVVVDELDIIRTSFMPGEAESPLGVDPNAVLAASIASQSLEPVARWDAQVFDIGCCV